MDAQKTVDARVRMYLNQVARTKNTNHLKAYKAMKESQLLNPDNPDK